MLNVRFGARWWATVNLLRSYRKIPHIGHTGTREYW